MSSPREIDFEVRQAKQQYGWMHEKNMSNIETLHKHLDGTKRGHLQNLDPKFFRGWNPTKEMVEAMQALGDEFDRTAVQFKALQERVIATYRIVKSTAQYDICVDELKQPEPDYQAILNIASIWFEINPIPKDHPNYQKFFEMVKQLVQSNPAKVRKWLDDCQCDVIKQILIDCEG